MNKNMYLVLGLIVVVVLVVVALAMQKNKLPANAPAEENTNTQQAGTVTMVEGTGVYNVDPALSQVAWEGKKTLVEGWLDTGNISVQSGSVNIENGALVGANIVIDMNSIKANKTGSGGGEDKLSGHLKSADFFDVEKFPTASFVLTSATLADEAGVYNVAGDMTIKGITKAVNLPAKISMQDGKLVVEGDLVVNRAEFDVRFGSGSFFSDLGDNIIDDNFTLKLKLVANGAVNPAGTMEEGTVDEGANPEDLIAE